MKLICDISIGQNLSQLRRSNGYTQSSLATLLQSEGYFISRDIISKIENGKYNIPISILKRLKELYGISYDDFFSDIWSDYKSKH